MRLNKQVFLFFSSFCLISVRFFVRYLGFGGHVPHSIELHIFILKFVCKFFYRRIRGEKKKKKRRNRWKKERYSIQKSITQHLQWQWAMRARVGIYIYFFSFSISSHMTSNRWHSKTFYSSKPNTIMHFEIAFNGR